MNLLTALKVLDLRGALLKREAMNRVELEKYQAFQLAALRGYAYSHSPFYKKFHAGLEEAPIEQLPVLTKKVLMDNFDDLVTDRSIRLEDAIRHLAGEGGLFQKQFYVASTSGTTGLKGIFPYSQQEWNGIIASFDRANRWAGLKPRLLSRMKMAMVSSRVPWHQSSLLGSTVQSLWVSSLRLDAMDPMKEINSRLNRFQPECLAGYAGMIGALALEQLAGRLHIQPKAALCSSEVLTGEARAHIQKAWGIEPFNVYASTETATIASECGCHLGMHVYEDLVIAENVDSSYRPIPPGKFGEKLLVTVLFSRTLPLIRYEIGDSVMFSGKNCTCGIVLRLMEKVQGRQEDILRMKTSAGGLKQIHPVFFHALFEPMELGGWQVVQHSGGLKIKVIPLKQPLDQGKLRCSIEDALSLSGIEVPNVEIEAVQTFDKGALGKDRLIIGTGK